jgi:hypothetical protein
MNSDLQDFQTLAVWNLEDALQAAFKAGQASIKK